MLNVVDEFTHECLMIRINRKLKAVDVIDVLSDLFILRGVPGHIRSDNGPEFVAKAVQEWIAAVGARTAYIAPPSDPAAQWTGALRGPAFFAYANNYLVDTANAIIVDVEASRAIRQAEVETSRSMIDRTEERLGLKPKRLAADSAYGSAANLAWLVEKKGITPHIPVIDKSGRTDGTFSRADFSFDPERDIYVCPTGKILTTTGRVLSDNTLRYLASTRDCGPCPLKRRCCPNTPSRKIPRDINEDARDVARAVHATPAFEQSRRDRKRVEMLFAHLKRILKLGRLRLRGPCGAQDEFLLAATAQNLRKLARLRPELLPAVQPG